MDRKLQLLLLAVGFVFFVSYLNDFQPPSSFPSPPSSSSKFHIDYIRNVFMLDGKQFDYVSGSLHYFRVPHQLWYDRLLKLRASGINVVSTYVPWNLHEPHVNHFNFEQDADLTNFIQIAHELGLYVNIRPGPYICSEWELGGLPYFTLGTPADNITLRSSDERFLLHVERYFGVLLPRLKPHLIQNGGPIILVQVENEYGSSRTCDSPYKDFLVSLIRHHLGDEVVLYTADGWDLHHLVCGPVHKDGVLTTVNFGPNSKHHPAFTRMRYFQKGGPLVNSEYYPGWLDHWGEPHQTKSNELVLREFTSMLTSTMGVIYVNFYMFFGGTNFGFYNGANMAVEAKYQPDPTSYDYDAPLTECGDVTSKYYAIRDAIKKHRPMIFDESLLSKVHNSTKKAYGKVYLEKILPFTSIKELSTSTFTTQGPTPLTFEDVKQDFGYVLYEPGFSIPSQSDNEIELTIDKPRDRVTVYTDGKFVGAIYRNDKIRKLKIPKFERLSLLAENMGRINYGPHIHDFKGILGDIKLSSGARVTSWKMWTLPLNNTKSANFRSLHQDHTEPGCLLQGTFQVDSNPADTWIKMDWFTKGVIFVNNRNVGRYWPKEGPQRHIYVPAVWLRRGSNTLTLFESDALPNNRMNLFVELVDHPDLGGVKTDLLNVKYF